MLRLFGGVLILGGGMLLRGTLLSASRRELQTQYELREALMLLEKEITFTLTPLPKLLLRKDFGTCQQGTLPGENARAELVRLRTGAVPAAAHQRALCTPWGEPRRRRDRCAADAAAHGRGAFRQHRDAGARTARA